MGPAAMDGKQPDAGPRDGATLQFGNPAARQVRREAKNR
jgi:hypothetical protein